MSETALPTGTDAVAPQRSAGYLSQRSALLFATLACLVIQFVSEIPFLQIRTKRFTAGEINWVLSELVSITVTFALLYSTPLFAGKQSSIRRLGRVIALMATAYAVVMGVLVLRLLLWLLASFVLGIPPRLA